MCFLIDGDHTIKWREGDMTSSDRTVCCVVFYDLWIAWIDGFFTHQSMILNPSCGSWSSRSVTFWLQ